MAEIKQVADGVYRIKDGLVNCYLLEEGGELTLVDAAWPRSWNAIQEAVGEIGRQPGQITAIALTHGHPDHLGAAEAARKQLGAPVYAHRPEIERAKGESKNSNPWKMVPALTTQIWRPPNLGFVLQAAGKGFLMPTWVSELIAFEAGQTLDVPGRPQVVATPGHTEGHVSFLLPQGGVVISGDAMATYDPVLGAHGPRLLHDLLNGDPAQTRRSLGALEQLDAGMLLPGHGEPYSGPIGEAVAEARTHAG